MLAKIKFIDNNNNNNKNNTDNENDDKKYKQSFATNDINLHNNLMCYHYYCGRCAYRFKVMLDCQVREIKIKTTCSNCYQEFCIKSIQTRTVYNDNNNISMIIKKQQYDYRYNSFILNNGEHNYNIISDEEHRKQSDIKLKESQKQIRLEYIKQIKQMMSLKK